MNGVVRALVSGIVLAILAWLGCWAFEEIARETKGDFPDGILCVLVWIAAVCAWVYYNFGGAWARR